MAINKAISTRFGINANHHIINKIDIDRNTNSLQFNILSFENVTKYNSGFDAMTGDENIFSFSQLPGSVLTKIIELKNIIELEMINNIPKWQGGIQVSDT